MYADEPNYFDMVPSMSPSEDELGVAIPVEAMLARSPNAAVVVRSVVAYSTGLTLDLAFLLRPGTESESWPVILRGDDGLHVGIGGDQGPVAMGPLHMPQLATAPYWICGISGGDGRRYSASLWINPLPDVGELTVGLSWRRFAIPKTTSTLTVSTPTDVAARSVRIWPPD